MAAQSLPGPSSSKPIWNYDVFLSFRGEDTRKNFTDHLYTALIQAGIHTFRDDDELRRGKEISSELLKAIEESRISIVVFSKGYASSSWCLDELVKILECKNNNKGQTVLPIFYDVDPSHVRHQISTFAEAFDQHEKRFNLERMQKWRAALTEAANLSGYDLQNVANGHEAKFIQKVVEDVLIEVNHTCLNVAIHPIGIDSRVEEMKELLNVGTSDIRIVGIYGMGGIGKTTIAKAVYNEIHYGFDGSSCLLNIKEISEQPNGLVQLQEQLLSDILKTKILNIGNSDRGINLIKERLHHKRVFIVLDDVDNLKQLNSLAGNYNWFGYGSRVIITTRDESLLIEVGVYGKYEAKKLSHDESLQLFSWHAFKNNHPIEDYLNLSNAVVDYVGGLPLALEVMGSYLLGRSLEEWKSALEKLQKIPHRQIQKILRISFDSLDDDTLKDTFLDIAFFFIGMKKEYAMKILDGCGFFPDISISILIQRSLVTINCNNELRMHDLLRDMGREIVRDMSPNDPGKRSRLWFHEDVLNVLKKQTGSEAMEGLVLNLPKFENVHLKTEAFAKMKSLRLLQINGVYLSGCFEHLSQELRWLCWHNCPLEFLPSNFPLESLVVLDMQYSKVKQVWQGIKILNKLELLDLSNSKYLTATPNFLKVPRLKRLILKGCTNLVEVHDSIGNLKKLVFLNLEGCSSLENLPFSICNILESLEINLSGCSKLDKQWNTRASRVLIAYGTLIDQLESTFFQLKYLETFVLENRRTLSSCGRTGQPSIPELMKFWKLKKIQIRPVLELDLLPEQFGNMEASRVLAYITAIKQLASTFDRLKDLKTQSLSGCKGQPSIPEAYVKREDEKKKGQKMEFVSAGGQPGPVAAAPKVNMPIPAAVTEQPYLRRRHRTAQPPHLSQSRPDSAPSLTPVVPTQSLPSDHPRQLPSPVKSAFFQVGEGVYNFFARRFFTQEANVKREDAGEQPGTVAAEPEVNMPIPGGKGNEIRSLHAAALNGNWRVVEVLLQKDPTLLQSDLTTAKDTALHIATRANRSAFVEKLINNLSKDDLALQTTSGDTALSIAAMSGFMDIAKKMISANDELPNLVNKYDLQPPLFKAIRSLHKEMALYLFPCTNISLLKLEDRIRLFVAMVISEMYDMALKMLEKDAMLAYCRDDKGLKLTALCVLARKPQDICSGIYGDFGEAFKPTLAYQLLEKIWAQVLKLKNEEILILKQVTRSALYEAVKSGNVEFVSLLFESFPNLIQEEDEYCEPLFHAAILYRQEKIFNLIYNKVEAFKDYVVTLIDADGNNMLHLAGKLSPEEKLDTSRPNLQMQRELFWFKEMQKIMPRQFTEMKNHENLTPKVVFEREHKELITESRTAMKETASSCMVLSIIISTIVIAFAFTVPGFSNSTVQTLIFPKDTWFMIFWVSNTVALLSSGTSIVMLLRILTSPFGGSEYITSLRANMMCGFTALFVTITSIAIAFTAAVFMTCGLLV